jgi:hypothetical protein
MNRMIAAALGIGLAALWVLGFSYDAPVWLAWLDGAAAFIALAGVATVGSADLAGVSTWPILALGLFALWLFALSAGAPSWLAWLNLLAGCGFLALTAASVLAPRRHARV